MHLSRDTDSAIYDVTISIYKSITTATHACVYYRSCASQRDAAKQAAIEYPPHPPPPPSGKNDKNSRIKKRGDFLTRTIFYTKRFINCAGLKKKKIERRDQILNRYKKLPAEFIGHRDLYTRYLKKKYYRQT